jgi:hypothetical protein
MQENKTVLENVIVNADAIRTEKVIGEIKVDEIFTSDYQKEDTVTAQLRQVIKITSYYPTKRISNNMQDNLFSIDEFGFEEKAYVNSENRVCWLDVPKNTTIEQIVEKLEKAKDACLYKVLSNKPILTDNQEYAISQNIRTYDEFANSQVIRYPEGTKIEGENGEMEDVSGQIVLDKNGKVQYRRVFFSTSKKADLDYRTQKEDDFYMSEDIKSELYGAATNTKQVI